MSDVFHVQDGCLAPMPLSIKQVQQSFADAAVSYDAAATVQYQVAQDLCAHIPFSTLPKQAKVLDVGCGTGSLGYILASQYKKQVLPWQQMALDIALPMLLAAKNKQVANAYVLADAQSLPFASEGFDLCMSNMALQWCDFSTVLAESYRVLQVGGQFVMSLVLPKTFWQLAHVWQQQGLATPVMPFASQAQLLSGIDGEKWHIALNQVQIYQAHYPDLRTMLHAIKSTGAQQYPKNGPMGLMGKARWQALQSDFALLADDLGLPLDYHLLFLVLEKKHHEPNA